MRSARTRSRKKAEQTPQQARIVLYFSQRYILLFKRPTSGEFRGETGRLAPYQGARVAPFVSACFELRIAANCNNNSLLLEFIRSSGRFCCRSCGNWQDVE